MHELSIAQNIVRIGINTVDKLDEKKVNRVFLQIEDLSGVVKDALEFSFDIATQGTLLEGAALVIEEIPVAIYCATCDAVNDLSEKYRFRCPICQQPSVDIRKGKELEVSSIEVE